MFFCNLDVDECSAIPCGGHGYCSNTAGSYLCICYSGFSGNGTSCTGKINFLFDNFTGVKTFPTAI